MKDIVQFFIAVDNYNTRKQDDKVANDIKLFKTNINDGFKNIGQFDIKIKDYFLNKNSSVALKEYCLKVIKESFYFLNNNLYIEFEKCPIQSDYENLLFKLEIILGNWAPSHLVKVQEVVSRLKDCQTSSF